MAEKLCTLRTKGGGGGQKYTETSLWTNPSPSSSFSAQDVTLSESMDNFKYLAFKFGYSTTAQTGDCCGVEIVEVSEFKKASYPSSNSRVLYVLGGSASVSFTRNVMYTSGTVRFGGAYQISTTTNNNAYCIPLEILGLNELAHGKRESSLGTLTYQTSSNFKVTLGYKPKALQVILRGNDTNTITLQYDESISTTKYIRNYTASTPQSGWQTIGSTTNQRRLLSIDDDGFTLTPNTDTSTQTIYYSAVGDV